jgi:ribonuclease BN (tRNA processing enzyme)
MIIQVLGCHGSDCRIVDGTQARECSTCSFLINGRLLLDAGTIGNKLDVDEQKRITDVLLTHLHLDHIRALANLADNLVDGMQQPLSVAGLDAVHEGLRAHIFNNAVYPDFFRIPDPVEPVLRWRSLVLNQPNHFSGITVTPVPVHHTVPALGFVIEDDGGAVLFSGDTGPTEQLWEVGRSVRNLKAVFIECSYPNAMRDLAERSRHLTPELLAIEFAKLHRPEVPVYPYHLKPIFRDRIRTELSLADLPEWRVLEEGQVLKL